MKIVLAIWCVLMLMLGGIKFYEEYKLDLSWQKYADEWVEAHTGGDSRR